MMYRYSFFLFLVFNSVFCEDCVTVDFENGLEGNFTNTYGRCFGLPMWNIGHYSSFNMTGLHPDSTQFVTLQPTWTCMTSFIFTITRGGLLEVNAYVGFRDNSDLVWVDIIQYVDGGNDIFVAQGGFYPGQANVNPSWRTLRIPIPGSGRFEGYIMFWGVASSRSIFLMDSFRYIAPSLDTDLCQIYTEEKTFTTTNVPTTIVSTELPTTTTTELPITTKLPFTETEIPTTTSEISTITTITTESPTIITTTTELPTTTTEIPVTITTTVLPTITTEIPTTTTYTTDSSTLPAITTELPATTTEISTGTTKTTITPSLTTETTGPTSTTPGTSTESPRYSLYYILIIKIKRYFEQDCFGEK